MQLQSSRKTMWIILGVGGGVLVCICVGTALIFGAGVLASVRRVQLSGDPAYISQATPTALPGGDWKRVEGLPRRVNAFVTFRGNPNIMFAATGSLGEGGGVFMSRDGGNTWKRTGNGLPDDVVAGLAVDGFQETMYANVGSDSEIYMSRYGGNTWKKAGDNPYLCCNVNRRMVIDPRDSQ